MLYKILKTVSESTWRPDSKTVFKFFYNVYSPSYIDVYKMILERCGIASAHQAEWLILNFIMLWVTLYPHSSILH